MINAYKNFFKGYVDFTGRSTRSEYWWVWLVNNILFYPFIYSIFEWPGMMLEKQILF